MKTENKMARVVLGFSVMVVIASSCAAQRTNLVSNGTISVEKVRSEDFFISRAYVYQEGDDIVISGRLKSKGHKIFTLGHMDAALTAPDGSIISQASARLIMKDHQPSNWDSEYAFGFRLAVTLPTGSTVRLALHEPDYSRGDMFDCDDNKAASEVREE